MVTRAIYECALVLAVVTGCGAITYGGVHHNAAVVALGVIALVITLAIAQNTEAC